MNIDSNRRQRPLISFVVTYHNEDVAMLIECVESIINLSLSKDERQVVVIDDGSDVCPMNSLMAYADDVIYVRKPNAGPGAARNTGIMMATGEYLQFVDADDKLVKFYYEQCIDVVRYADPDMVMFGHTTKDDGEMQVTLPPEKAFTGAEFMRNNNLRGMACGYVFKKDILHNLRYPEDIYHEDEEFTPQLVLRCERLYVTDSPAYFYRQHQGTTMSNRDKRWKVKRLDDMETVIMRLYRKTDTLPHVERQALQWRIAQLTMDYLYNIIILTHSRRFLDERIERLEKEGLFPMPEKAYTKKYALFGKLIKTKWGRNVMLMGLPLMKRWN